MESMLTRLQFLKGLLALALLVPLSGGAEDLAKLRQQLARESDADDRAKITVKIGRELLKQISHAYDKGTPEEAERLLGEYREAIRDAHEDLKESGRDARRKPKGFKDLEIHLRKSTRKLEDLGHALSFDQRTVLDEAIAEMNAIRQELLENLMRRDDRQDSGGV
jgi:hypothetical protein